jgi:hypothetical protein
MTVELNNSLVDGLPFEPKQQDALLGFALIDLNFFLQIKDRVQANWFVDGWAGKAYDAYCKFFVQFGHLPKSDDELFLFEEVFKLPPMERTKLKAAVLKARNETNNYSLDVLQSGLTGWLQSRIYHKYVSQSATLFNNRKFTEAKSVLAEAVKELQEISFEGKPPADFSNPAALVQEILLDVGNAMTLGHPVLDRILNPDCPKGSLLPGDATCLLAPTNIGKTTAKVTIACANLWAGKSVIFITHEGRKHDLMEKIWQCMLGVTKQQFRQLALSPDATQQALMAQVAQILQRQLLYIDYQKPGSTVEEVVSMVRQHQQRRKAKTGSGFDMFLNDYPAILGAEGLKNLRTERRHKDAYVYRYLVDYAGDQKMHGLYSIQTNREGSKKNRKVGEYHNKNMLVTLEDVQEAYEVTNSATNLITVNRSPQDQGRDIITYLLCKSRSSETNIAVTCRSNFRIARTHDASLPAMWFRGTDSLDQLDSLLSEYNNKEVPFNYKELRNDTKSS